MARNDFLPVTDDRPKKSTKKQVIWTAVITVIVVFFTIPLVYGLGYHNEYNYAITGSVIVMMISIGLTFFLNLGILLLKSIEWKEPEKCDRTLHYFYLTILVLTLVGLTAGITGLVD